MENIQVENIEVKNLTNVRFAFGHKARSGKDHAIETVKALVHKADASGTVHVIRLSEPVYRIGSVIQSSLHRAFNVDSKTVDISLRHIAIVISGEIEDILKVNGVDVNYRVQSAVFEWLRGTVFKNAITKGLGEYGSPCPKLPWLLQAIGEDFRTLIDEDIWANIATRKILELLTRDHNANICIPDLRYKNEAVIFRKLNFTLIDINRPSRPIDRDPNHKSETDLDGYAFDFIIDNVGTVEEYDQKIMRLCSQHYYNTLIKLDPNSVVSRRL